jgi:hypothetical protein
MGKSIDKREAWCRENYERFDSCPSRGMSRLVPCCSNRVVMDFGRALGRSASLSVRSYKCFKRALAGVLREVVHVLLWLRAFRGGEHSKTSWGYRRKSRELKRKIRPQSRPAAVVKFLVRNDFRLSTSWGYFSLKFVRLHERSRTLVPALKASAR